MNSKFMCTGCKLYFPSADKITINRSTFHSYECASAHGLAKDKKQKVKADKQSHAKKKRELKDNDKSFQVKKTQGIVNKFIRIRDLHDNCISCNHRGSAGGYVGGGGIHAGHYRSVGACPELRYQPLNIHAQCAQCNNNKSGNSIEYRIRLIKKIGTEKVEWLEGPHPAKKYTIANLKVIQKWFTRKTKRLEKDNANH